MQNRFIATLLSGKLAKAQYVEMEGASLVMPDSNGITPLQAAIRSLNFKAVQHIEDKLGDKAADEWEKIDFKKEKEHIEKAMQTNFLFNADGERASGWSGSKMTAGFFNRGPVSQPEKREHLLCAQASQPEQHNVAEEVIKEKRNELDKLIKHVESKAGYQLNTSYQF